MIGIIICIFDLWHLRKPYSSLTSNTIPPHAGPFKRIRFVGLFEIINKYIAAMKADMHFSHPIFKTLWLLFERWGCCLFNTWITYFWMWITEVSFANIGLILEYNSGWGLTKRLSQLKLIRNLPNFIPIRHVWNFPGLDDSSEIPQSSLFRFTQCDYSSAIITVASPSFPEIFLVTTLVFLVPTISPLKPKQPEWIATMERWTNKGIAGIEGMKRAP